MKDLVLDNTLIIGVDEIDDDHEKLINLFNILNHSVTVSENCRRSFFKQENLMKKNNSDF